MKNQSEFHDDQSAVRLDYISRFNFNLFDFRFEKHDYDFVIANDLSIISKIKHNQLNVPMKIGVSRHRRIEQRRLIKKLKS